MDVAEGQGRQSSEHHKRQGREGFASPNAICFTYSLYVRRPSSYKNAIWAMVAGFIMPRTFQVVRLWLAQLDHDAAEYQAVEPMTSELEYSDDDDDFPACIHPSTTRLRYQLFQLGLSGPRQTVGKQANYLSHPGVVLS